METKLDTKKIVYNTLTNLLVYSEQIIKAQNSESFYDYSDLYSKIVILNKDDDEEILSSFSEYYELFYCKMFFFQQKESFEACEILKVAMEKETKFILNSLIKDKEMKKTILEIKEELREYYFDEKTI